MQRLFVATLVAVYLVDISLSLSDQSIQHDAIKVVAPSRKRSMNSDSLSILRTQDNSLERDTSKEDILHELRKGLSLKDAKLVYNELMKRSREETSRPGRRWGATSDVQRALPNGGGVPTGMWGKDSSEYTLPRGLWGKDQGPPPGLWGKKKDGPPPGIWGKDQQARGKADLGPPLGIWGKDSSGPPPGIWGKDEGPPPGLWGKDGKRDAKVANEMTTADNKDENSEKLHEPRYPQCLFQRPYCYPRWKDQPAASFMPWYRPAGLWGDHKKRSRE